MNLCGVGLSTSFNDFFDFGVGDEVSRTLCDLLLCLECFNLGVGDGVPLSTGDLLIDFGVGEGVALFLPLGDLSSFKCFDLGVGDGEELSRALFVRETLLLDLKSL